MGAFKAIVAILSAGLHMEASAQTFNKRFDLFNEMRSQTAWGIEVRSDGSALIIFNGPYSTPDSSFGSAVSSVIVNTNGQFSSGYRFQLPGRNTFPGWANCAAPLDTGGYILGGGAEAVGDTHRVTLYWISEMGVVVNHRELDLPGSVWIGRNGRQTADGGFVVVGDKANGNHLDAFVVKTDGQGEVEWYQTYGAPGLYESLTSIQEAPWGGYYIGGSRETSTWVWEPWIIRVDEVGNVIGEADYGSPFHEEPAAQLTLASNGNVIAAGAMSLGSGVQDGRAMLYEVDQNGAVVWQNLYGPLTRAVLFTVHQVPGSTDLIAAGFDDRTEIAQPIKGTLLRTTGTGDSLWMRNYAYYDSLVELGNAGFYDMQPTPDGGFIAVGFAMSVWQQGGSGWEEVYSQDVWVVKTDSMGCIEPGCHLIQGMETQITNLRGALTVAPNPVAEGAPVQVRLDLPASFTPQGTLRLTVVSNDGRIVDQQAVRTSSSQLTIDNLLPGLYHVHVSDDTRWISGAKLVVE